MEFSEWFMQYAWVMMFASTMLMLLVGFPVSFTLSGVAVVWALIGAVFFDFDMSIMGALPSRIYGGAITNTLLIAIPLFVFMGAILEKSKIAEDLLSGMGKLMSSIPGGLGISVIIVGAFLAASTGIVGATVVTMGMMSLPAMLKNKYETGVACGSICAAGTLGQIIPPSIVLILLGDQISSAYVEAQREVGNWSPDPVSVGDLFVGAIIPGIVLVGLYIAYIFVRAILKPQDLPAVSSEGVNVQELIFKVLLPPLALIVVTLGSILSGVATPTEAASVASVFAILLATYRMADNVRIKNKIMFSVVSMGVLLAMGTFFDMRPNSTTLSLGDMVAIVFGFGVILYVFYVVYLSLKVLSAKGILSHVSKETLLCTAQILVILIGATVFSLVFRAYGGDEAIADFLLGLEYSFAVKMLLIMILLFVLGMFLDFIEIILVVIPIIAPVMLQSDVSPVWFAIMVAMNLQTSFLTPPFGFSLFYLRGVAPDSVKTADIYRGVLPFIVLQLVAIGLLAYFPQMSNWLPELIFGSKF